MSSTVRRAIVPIAGLGTRHFPASHAVKKEFFPVVGPDGIARALFHYHLLEMESAGIERIAIIVQPGEEALVQNYLAGPGDDYLRRLEKYPRLAAEAERMRGFADRIEFAVQTTQEGYGHAVFQSASFAGDGPVLLCLGDHLFRGVRVSPYAELCAVHAAHPQHSLSAVNRITEQELRGYGTIAGRRLSTDPRLIEVSLIVEKPEPALARERLHVDGLPDGTWLGWFGMHVLRPSIFDVLARMIRDDIRDGGEFQLTRAQEIQRQEEGYLALEMEDARRFDFGIPDDFVRSVHEFRHG